MSKTIIIAEAGVNHNGDIEIAKRLIDVASDAGADYVKFQTFKADKLVSVTAKKADYQIRNTGAGAGDTQYDMLKKLELKQEQHTVLIEHCKKNNIKFLSTPFDEGSMDFLISLNVDLIKIPSGEITNLPFLEHAAKSKKRIVFSTGMSTMTEIESALAVFVNAGLPGKDIVILHCNTEYPTPYEDVNLSAMTTIKEKTGVEVGYSDHTNGIEVAIAAVALGASVIEKHFTLDRKMEGPDHKASLEPAELKQMIRSIRHIEKAMGDGIKKASASEQKNMAIARKSIHLNVNIRKGDVIGLEHLVMKRPGDGISPMQYKDIVGRKVKQDLPADHKLSISDLI